MISSIRQVEQRILTETGEIPSADEIAKELGVSATKVRALQLYDLNGRRIVTAQKGIQIVKKMMSDGTVKTQKVVK